MKKIILILSICLLLFANPIFSLKMLEPITYNFINTDKVDVGYYSANEFFMVSFLLEDQENYNEIKIHPSQQKQVTLEKTTKTQESVFTILKLNETIKGDFDLRLVLVSDNLEREITLKMHITDDVIHTSITKYNTQVEFGKKEKIQLKVINKSNSTKKVILDSDLSKKWFKNTLTKQKHFILAPNSTTQVEYEYYPAGFGEKQFKLFIKPSVDENLNSEINYTLNIFVNKNFNSVFNSYAHYYPLFNQNFIPLYFFNKIISFI